MSKILINIDNVKNLFLYKTNNTNNITIDNVPLNLKNEDKDIILNIKNIDNLNINNYTKKKYNNNMNYTNKSYNNYNNLNKTDKTRSFLFERQLSDDQQSGNIRNTHTHTYKDNFISNNNKLNKPILLSDMAPINNIEEKNSKLINTDIHNKLANSIFMNTDIRNKLVDNKLMDNKLMNNKLMDNKFINPNTDVIDNCELDNKFREECQNRNIPLENSV
jgi:hypothetical protein